MDDGYKELFKILTEKEDSHKPSDLSDLLDCPCCGSGDLHATEWRFGRIYGGIICLQCGLKMKCNLTDIRRKYYIMI
jgi:transcription elongation factor Elf1